MGWCLGLMQGGSTAGGVFGPLIGGVLAEVFGMRASFYFAGAALGLIALGLIVFIKGGEQKKVVKTVEKKKSGGSMKLLKVPVIQRMLLPRRSFSLPSCWFSRFCPFTLLNCKARWTTS